MDAGTQLDAARQMLGEDLEQLWVAYFGLGGTASPNHIESYLRGEATLDPVQHDMLAHAINERFTEEGMDHPAPYTEDVAGDEDALS
ncbi:MAG: hypothetical protein JWP02_901 [Acidimicrobiales bacterium]|nr:hypothetical protein [Acidimicrobiales bacterium]